MKKNPFKMHRVISSNLALAGYDKENQKMRVSFHTGKTYEYDNVPEEVYKGIFTSDSPGLYFRKTVVDSKRFKSKKL